MLIEDIKSGADGKEIIRYMVPNASQDVPGNIREGGEEYFYDAGGLKKMIQKSQQRKDLKSKSKNEARLIKAQAKKSESDAKQLSALAAKEGVKGDIAIADALKSGEAKEEKGMGMGVKIAIGAAILAAIGTIGYFAVKAMKKKK